MNRKLLLKIVIAISLVVIFFLSESIGIQLDISQLLGGLL